MANGKTGELVRGWGALLLSVVVALCTAVFWISGRTETPQEKEKRIRTILEPTQVKIQAIEQYHATMDRFGGHPTMDRRVKSVEDDITEIKDTNRQILREIRALRNGG